MEEGHQKEDEICYAILYYKESRVGAVIETPQKIYTVISSRSYGHPIVMQALDRMTKTSLFDFDYFEALENENLFWQIELAAPVSELKQITMYSGCDQHRLLKVILPNIHQQHTH